MQLRSLLTILLLLMIGYQSYAKNYGYMEKVAQRVLDDIYSATANHMYLKPQLIISTETKDVASYNDYKKELKFEVKAYQLCSRMGRDSLGAMAFILGHELAHSLQHEVKDHATSFLKYAEGMQHSTRTEKVADIQGAMSAYLAGFNIRKIIPKVIENIYTDYNLMGKQLYGYPSYQERRATASEVQTKVNELVTIYENANFLSALGEYELASSSYDYILQFYQGREIYNNIGVSLAQNAMNFTEMYADFFIFPLEIDWDTRLKKPKARGGAKDLNIKDQQYRRKLLVAAQKNFEHARRLDPRYLTADINLMCVYTLLDNPRKTIDYYKSRGILTKAKTTRAGEVEIQKVQLIYAIACASIKMGTFQSEARSIFQELGRSRNSQIAYLAQYNLKVMDDELDKNIASGYSCVEPFNTSGNMDGVILHRVSSPNKLNLDKNCTFAFKSFNDSSVAIYNSNRSGSFKLQRIRGRGNTRPLVSKGAINDQKLNIVTTTNGYFLICEENKTIFRCDRNDRVLEWAKFHSN